MWLIDFVLECSLYQLYDLHMDGSLKANNYQGILGPGPDFEPQALYYGMIFSSLMMTDTPALVLPLVTAGTSSNIKIWGLESTFEVHIVVINKDTDPTLDSSVLIQIRSAETSRLSCIYLEAPSLDSKADEMTIGGHKYVAGNATPTGTYERKLINYDPET